MDAFFLLRCAYCHAPVGRERPSARLCVDCASIGLLEELFDRPVMVKPPELYFEQLARLVRWETARLTGDEL